MVVASLLAISANAATVTFVPGNLVWDAVNGVSTVKLQYDCFTDAYYLNGNTSTPFISGWSNGVLSSNNAARNNDSAYWLAGLDYSSSPTVIIWKFDFSSTGSLITGLSVRNDMLVNRDGLDTSAEFCVSTDGTNWNQYRYLVTSSANPSVTDGGAYHDISAYVAGANVYYIKAQLNHIWGKNTPQIFRANGSPHYDAFVNNVTLVPVPTTKAPVFDPAGPAISGDLSVTISSETAGAVIYYTTDGSTPTTGGTAYTNPTTVVLSSGNMTLKAIASASGSVSTVTTQTYEYVEVLDPTFTPAALYFSGPTEVMITSGTQDASIYYTLNGEIPTSNSTLYTAPFALTSDAAIIKAVAIKNGISSNVVTKRYYSNQLAGKVVNGTFDNGLNGWSGWIPAGDGFSYSACVDNSWTPAVNYGAITVGSNGGNPFAQGTHLEYWGSFGLYQVIPVIKGALYTINADWMSDTGMEYNSGSWCEFIAYTATEAEIDDMNIVLRNNNQMFPQASIIAKKDTFPDLNNAASAWEWESITGSMGGNFGNAKGTNTFKATTDFMVVITKYCAYNNVRVAWDNIALTLSAPGDANADGKVDVGDLGILAANYGMTSGATWDVGDFNVDGKVDVGDLGILAANYGTGSASGSSFDADYAKVFGTVASEDEISSDSLCSGLGLSLIAGLTAMGLMLVKLEE
jgi:hypothetical protein